jgi:predicted RNase H-like nuclease (RuvC/YqgF family)
MGVPKPWGEMTVDEKLETLRNDMQIHQRQSTAMAKALDEMGRRLEEIEQRFEELLFD